MRFTISQQPGGQPSCSIVGSLHKFKNEGTTNADDFTFYELVDILDTLQSTYSIDLEQATIHSIEIGVNVELECPVKSLLKSIVCHKGRAFTLIDKHDRWLGLVCTYTDYALKLYDKGKQSGTDTSGRNLLRVELKISRQRVLDECSISKLSDLQCAEKVAPLVGLLLERISEIIFFDFNLDTSHLSESKRLKWERYSNPNYWDNLNRNTLHKQRIQYGLIAARYGAFDHIKMLIIKVSEKWGEMLNSKPENRRRFPQVFEPVESTKQATFSNLEYSWKLSPKGGEKYSEKNEVEKRCFCTSCGRELVGQKKGSRFCSEKIYGAIAKKCRNKDSNRRLAVKRKLKRAMEKKQMLLVTYESEGVEYSDTLAADEIKTTREWLDKVKKVRVLKPDPVELEGDKAKEYISKLNN